MKTSDNSSEAVMHTLRRFDAAKFPYAIRMTATEAYLEQLPSAVAFIGEHFKPQRIQIEPAYPIGRGQRMPSANTTRFIRAYRAARAIATKPGLTLDYSPVRLNRRSNHFCGITQDEFSLSPYGNVSACYSCFSKDNNLADVFFFTVSRMCIVPIMYLIGRCLKNSALGRYGIWIFAKGVLPNGIVPEIATTLT